MSIILMGTLADTPAPCLGPQNMPGLKATLVWDGGGPARQARVTATDLAAKAELGRLSAGDGLLVHGKAELTLRTADDGTLQPCLSVAVAEVIAGNPRPEPENRPAKAKQGRT